jgi:hypothetical protein
VLESGDLFAHWLTWAADLAKRSASAPEPPARLMSDMRLAWRMSATVSIPGFNSDALAGASSVVLAQGLAIR